MDGFKQRIIGALVLISLAVIFVPMLLDEPHDGRTTRSIEIPEEPDFPEVRIEPAERPVADNPIPRVPEPEAPPMATSSTTSGQTESEPLSADSVVQQAGQGSNSSPQPEATAVVEQPVTPAPTEEVVPAPEATGSESDSTAEIATGGYLIQLGSFGSDSNAKRLKASVEKAGFTAHTTQIDSGGKSYTRVIAGPFPDKKAADAAKLKLDSEFGLNTLVVVND